MQFAEWTHPKTSADVVFTKAKITILNRLTSNSKQPVPQNMTHYVLAVAKLGGYLGLSRLTDIHLRVELGRKLVSN